MPEWSFRVKISGVTSMTMGGRGGRRGGRVAHLWKQWKLWGILEEERGKGRKQGWKEGKNLRKWREKESGKRREKRKGNEEVKIKSLREKSETEQRTFSALSCTFKKTLKFVLGVPKLNFCVEIFKSRPPLTSGLVTPLVKIYSVGGNFALFKWKPIR